MIIFSKLILLVLLLSGCRQNGLINTPSIDNQSNEIAIVTSDLMPDSDFRFSSFTKQFISLQITDTHSSPYAGVYAKFLDNDTNLIKSGISDSTGLIHVNFLLPSSTAKVGITFLAIGILQDTLWLELNKSHSINLEDLYSLGTPISKMEKINSKNQIPKNLVSKLKVTSKILKEINVSLPKNKSVPTHNPQYIQHGVSHELDITDSAEVWITFIHENTNNNNSVGYFVYPTGSTPSSSSHLNKKMIFPNSSYKNSGGNLKTGTRVLLGSFSAGQTIGFYIISDGWDGNNVDESKQTYYSISDLNPESSDEKRKHLVLLKSSNNDHLILGFEDSNRENEDLVNFNRPKKDKKKKKKKNEINDFNAAVFVVQVSPFDKALKFNKILKVPGLSDRDGDGISDNNDDFPHDHDRASEVFYPSENSWGTLAFEDYYPTNGDYDFNDVVVNYQISEILDGNGNVKEIIAKFIAVATGAEFRNGFALYFPSIEGNIESKIISRAMQKNEKKWTLVSNGLIAHIFPNIHDGFNGQSFINTQDGTNELKGDTTVMRLILKSPEKLERAPYNAFIYRTSNPSLEIHMADFEPTPLFNNEYFNTKDDNSNQDIGKTFRNFNNLPWAINVQRTWSHPKEKIDILDAYPDFRGWVNSNGKKDRNWITSTKNLDKVWGNSLK
jgi:LruC domain-containing protein